jgi:hypothetical protein
MAATFVTGLLCTAVPYLASSNFNINDVLKSGPITSTFGGGHQRTWRVLVAGEIALSVALSIGAGLLIQTWHRLNQEELGFVPEG